MSILSMVFCYIAFYFLGLFLYERYSSRLVNLLKGRLYLLLSITVTGFLLLTGMPFLALLTGICFFILPRVLERKRKMDEERLFELQLCSAIDSISGSLRVGLSLYSGIERVADSYPPPLGDVFRKIILETRKGTELGNSIKKVAREYGNRELLLLSESLDIIMRSGGSVAKFMDVLSESMKNRIRLTERAKVLTSQQRFQAILLFFLPFFILFIMAFMDFRMVKAFLSSTTGFFLSTLALLLQFTGGYILWKMTGGNL